MAWHGICICIGIALFPLQTPHQGVPPSTRIEIQIQRHKNKKNPLIAFLSLLSVHLPAIPISPSHPFPPKTIRAPASSSVVSRVKVACHSSPGCDRHPILSRPSARNSPRFPNPCPATALSIFRLIQTFPHTRPTYIQTLQPSFPVLIVWVYVCGWPPARSRFKGSLC